MKLSLNWLKEFVKVKIKPEKLAEKLTLAGFEVEGINKVDGDIILDVAIPANRGDCFSVLGLAREVAAITNSKFKIQNSKFKIQKLKNEKIKIEVKDFELCSKYSYALVKNVKIKESPIWLKKRLESCGIRSINNVVDVTNYVMLELGQPLHAFDADELANPLRIKTREPLASKKIIVRRAKKGERIVTIDGVERELDNSILVIADSKRAIAVAGVMGGKETEVSEKTKDIILESAYFNPVSIRKTSKKLNLKTESSLRFEHRVDYNMVEKALERACRLIEKLAKGKTIEKIIITKKPIYLRKVIKVEKDYFSRLLGAEIGEEKIKNILSSLGFIVSEFDISPKLELQSLKPLLKEARKLIGKRYKYGANLKEAPKYFDCSSLVQYLYKKIGVTIPRCSIEQAEIGIGVSKYQLRPGDLIFTHGDKNHYNQNFPQGLGHVAVYLGNEKVVHASHQRKEVIEDDLRGFLKKRKVVCIRRIFSPRLRAQSSLFIITVPSWREDIYGKEDLVEEVGRIYDYNKLKLMFLKGEIKTPKLNEEVYYEDLIKDILVEPGLTEVYNYSFYSLNLLEKLNLDKNLHLKLKNPVNPDQEFLRISLLPLLLKNLEKNLRTTEEVKIFEIGKVYPKSTQLLKGNLPKEKRMIAGLIIGDYYKMKGIIEFLLEKLSVYDWKVEKTKNGIFDSLKSASLIVGGEKIGDFGEIKEEVKNKFDFEPIKNKKISLFEIDFSKLIKKIKTKKFQEISIFPSLRRDLAIVVDKKIPYLEIEKTIKNIDPLIKKVELFDVFESEKIGKDKKSLAFHLVFQSLKRTLKSEEIDSIIKIILEKLEERFGAKLRMV